ncbi:unnamed protein product [Protopolystoma xenopodis]|uniref:Uncharacterized protein n=1 Tax=Protopolystoma xenopodis TaxID=117903 RepID=A0A448WE89_9PLAT|nr:unnamed protein product [Protopolystoma xenopodis]
MEEICHKILDLYPADDGPQPATSNPGLDSAPHVSGASTLPTTVTDTPSGHMHQSFASRSLGSHTRQASSQPSMNPVLLRSSGLVSDESWGKRPRLNLADPTSGFNDLHPGNSSSGPINTGMLFRAFNCLYPCMHSSSSTASLTSSGKSFSQTNSASAQSHLHHPPPPPLPCHFSIVTSGATARSHAAGLESSNSISSASSCPTGTGISLNTNTIGFPQRGPSHLNVSSKAGCTLVVTAPTTGSSTCSGPIISTTSTSLLYLATTQSGPGVTIAPSLALPTFGGLALPPQSRIPHSTGLGLLPPGSAVSGLGA